LGELVVDYHPSVGEEVVIERPFDRDSFEARVKSVSGNPDDPPWNVEIGFERLDGSVDLNPTCKLSEVVGSRDPEKREACRVMQSHIIGIKQEIEAEEDRKLLDNY
jgi:hypothetical protein